MSGSEAGQSLAEHAVAMTVLVTIAMVLLRMFGGVLDALRAGATASAAGCGIYF